jgi:hypothetical protein
MRIRGLNTLGVVLGAIDEDIRQTRARRNPGRRAAAGSFPPASTSRGWPPFNAGGAHKPGGAGQENRGKNALAAPATNPATKLEHTFLLRFTVKLKIKSAFPEGPSQ